MWNTARLLLAAAALIAALSLARWLLHRAGRAPAAAEKRPAGIPAELRTDEVKILNFYAARVPQRGRPFTLCYGVWNAVRVELDPPLAEITPSISRCVEAMIDRPVRATLTAWGKDGRTARVQIELPVSEPPPEILFADVSSRQIHRGERFTLCYGVRGAARVRVEPGVMELPVSPKHCATWFPMEAPAKLIAESATGRAEVDLPVRMAAGP
jgi:hypothetical protein